MSLIPFRWPEPSIATKRFGGGTVLYAVLTRSKSATPSWRPLMYIDGFAAGSTGGAPLKLNGAADSAT